MFVHRHILRILNPTVSIDAALEDCRDNESGCTIVFQLLIFNAQFAQSLCS